MPGPTPRPINEKEMALVDGMAAGTPVAQIARELGVARSMCYEWLQRPRVIEYAERLVNEAGGALSVRMLVDMNETLAAGRRLTDASERAVVEVLRRLESGDTTNGEAVNLLGALDHHLSAMDKHLKTVADMQRIATGRPTSIKRLEVGESEPEEKQRDRKELLAQLRRITPAPGADGTAAPAKSDENEADIIDAETTRIETEDEADG